MKGIFNSSEEAVNHVHSAFKKARNKESNLSDGTEIANGVLRMFGMSGCMWRHFLNNLVNLNDVRYAEIGAHIGSTLCSAIYRNNNLSMAMTVDNWSQFSTSDTCNTLLQNVNAVANLSEFKNIDKQIKIFQHDFNTFDFSKVNPIDVYFFDGPHDDESQKQGILKAFESLSDVSILLVDDWNWGGPRRGTYAALESLPVQINYQSEIFTPPEVLNGQVVVNRFGNSDWHNGVGVFVITKI